VAVPPSQPLFPYTPVPAIVVMVAELRVTTRTRLFSAMYTLSLASTANALGDIRDAMLAKPPSLELPDVPVPAKVVMMPVLRVTMRTVDAVESAMYRLPLLSTASARVLYGSDVLVAGIPSPLDPIMPIMPIMPAVPVPA
jgi:hypothetical protein